MVYNKETRKATGFQILWRHSLVNDQFWNILPSILRSKGNQTIKFGQLIDYDIRNIFWRIIHKMQCSN